MDRLKQQSTLDAGNTRVTEPRRSTDSNSQNGNVLLEQIVENSLNEIYVFDARSLQFLNVNHGARQNLAYIVEEIRGPTPKDIKPEFDETKFRAFLKSLVERTKEKLIFETIHERKDGSNYPVEVHLLFYPDESPPVYAAIIQGIADRKKQHAELILCDRAIESLDVGVSITDATKENHLLVYINQTPCALTGYTPDEFLRRSDHFLQKDDRQQPEYLKIQEAQAIGKPVPVLFKSTRKNGSH